MRFAPRLAALALPTAASLGALLVAAPAHAAPEPHDHPGVIGGSPSLPGEYPSVGALVVEADGQRFFFCTGTLIAPTVVLTAGHCVTDDFLKGITPGFTFVLDANTVTHEQIVPGASKLAHPNWETQDIGLLFLAEPVTDVTPSSLPTAAEGAALAVDMPLEIAGYGRTNPNTDEAGIKHDAITRVASLGATLVGVGDAGDAQNCNGDSGGPAFAAVGPGGALRVVGVVTGGPESCMEGGFDTRVDAYLEWLTTNIGERGTPDAGPTVAADAGPGNDDGGQPSADDDDGGCGCAVGGASTAPRGLAVATLALAAVLTVTRRRRR